MYYNVINGNYWEVIDKDNFFNEKKMKGGIKVQMKKVKSFIYFLIVSIILTQIPFAETAFAGTTETQRIWGADRYKTSAAVSKQGWPSGSEYVILARGDDLADAICSLPLAYKYNCPILITPSNELDMDISGEIARLGVSHVIIVGGNGAVSQAVEDRLKSMGNLDIKRVYGADRFETSVKIAELAGQSGKAALVEGEAFTDAVSISLIAAKLGMPVLLTGKDSLPDKVGQYIKDSGVEITYLIGGEGAISKNIENSIPFPIRLFGGNRYETNIKILQEFRDSIDFDKIYVVSSEGEDEGGLADALTGLALAARTSSAFIMADNKISNIAADFISMNASLASEVIALGGESSVPEEVLAQVRSCIEKIGVTERYDTAGTYGPESGIRIINGNIVIGARDVMLQNTVITGDLLISEGVGNGTVSLKNVTVKGTTIVRGGGPNSVIMYDFNCQHVVVDIPEGSNVRLLAQDGTSIDTVTMESSGKLEESGLDGSGFNNVIIPAGVQVTLIGSFDTVKTDGMGAVIRFEQGSISTMNLNSPAVISGSGSIHTANIFSNDVIIQQSPDIIKIQDGITANINGNEVKKSTTEKHTLHSITLDDIDDTTIMNSQSRNIPVSTDPADVSLEVSTSDESIASAELSPDGSGITVTGKKIGSAHIFVTAKRSGYRSETREFLVNVEPLPMEITYGTPVFVEKETDEFTVTTKANDDAGRMVRAYFTLPEGCEAEYYEVNDGKWYPLPNVYGPESGFPIADITSRFKASFLKSGTYTVSVEFRAEDDDTVIGSKEIEVKVISREEDAKRLAIQVANEAISKLPKSINVRLSDEEAIREARRLANEAFDLGAVESDFTDFKKLGKVESALEALRSNATLSVFKIGGKDVLQLSGINTESGAQLCLTDTDELIGIEAVPTISEAGVTVKLNDGEIESPAEQTVKVDDTVTVTVKSYDVKATKTYKVTITACEDPDPDQVIQDFAIDGGITKDGESRTATFTWTPYEGATSIVMQIYEVITDEGEGGDGGKKGGSGGGEGGCGSSEGESGGKDSESGGCEKDTTVLQVSASGGCGDESPGGEQSGSDEEQGGSGGQGGCGDDEGGSGGKGGNGGGSIGGCPRGNWLDVQVGKWWARTDEPIGINDSSAVLYIKRGKKTTYKFRLKVTIGEAIGYSNEVTATIEGDGSCGETETLLKSLLDNILEFPGDSQTPDNGEITTPPDSGTSNGQDVTTPESESSDGQDMTAPESAPSDDQDVTAPESEPSDEQDVTAPEDQMPGDESIVPGDTGSNDTETIDNADDGTDSESTDVTDGAESSQNEESQISSDTDTESSAADEVE